jgi:PAS domain S-box-containing protein
MTAAPCILVVDDEDRVRTGLSRILKRKGYDVETAGTGKEALTLAKSRVFDLVLLDIYLQDTDGIDLIAPFQNLNHDVLVIMISGLASVGNTVSSLNAGAAGYLVKPIKNEELLTKVQDLLGRQQLIRKKRQAEEEALKESETKFRTLFDGASDAIIMMNSSIFLDCNRSTETLFDRSRDQIVGHSPAEFAPQHQPDGRLSIERSKERIEAALFGEPQFFEWVYYRSDRTPFHAEVTLNRILLKGDYLLQASVRDISRHRREQEVLKSPEMRYRRFFEAVRDGILILDADTGTILDVNPFLIELLGFTHEQFLGKKLWEIGVFKDIAASKDNFRELQEKKYIRFENLPLETADGRRIYAEFVSFVYDVEDKLVMQCNIRDITARKKAEEVLKSSESRYRRFFEAVRDGILILDADTGTILDVNPFLIELLGFTHEQFLGKKLWEIGVFKDIAASKDNFRELQEKKYIRFEDLPLETTNGQRIYVEFVSFVYDVEDKLVMQCNIRDITERKRAEEVLKSSESRYRRFFEAVRDGILIIDAETGTILDVNPFLIELLGFTHEQFLGKKLWEIGVFKDIAASKDNFRELQEKKYIRFEDLPLETADGRRIYAEFVSFVYDVEDKQVMQCNIRDITERKKAEAVLKSSESRYRRFFEAVRDGILILDAETGTILDVNPFLIELLGFTHEQFLGKKLWEIGVFKDIAASKDNFRELQEKKYIHFENLPLETADGKRIYAEFVSFVYDVENKKVMQCNIRDITERKQAEEVLKSSEMRYHRFFEAVRDGILILDTGTGTILDVNPFLIELLGFTHEQFLGKKLWEIGVFKDIAASKDNFRELQEKKYIHFENLPLETADGRRIYVEFVSFVYDVENKNVMQCNIRDITERKKAESALRESEKRYLMIGELIPFGVWMCDAEGKVIHLSDSFLNLIGITLDEAVRSGWMQHLPAGEGERAIADWNLCVQAAGFWDYEFRIIDRNGKEHFVLSRGAPLRDESGAVISWVGIHLDITERRRYQNGLETSLRENEILIKEVHHRVKNNMQVISGFLQLQSDYIDDPGAVDKLNECQRRVKTMALVHEKLYQSKSLEFIDTAEYIRSLVADLMDSSTLRTVVDVRVHVDPVNINLDTAIPCGLIINELMTNTLKHAFRDRPAGTVSVDLHLGADHWFTLVVQDDGVGLSPDFDPRSTASLGMQLVDILSRQLGGVLKVSNEQGARFEIRFPEKF